MENNTFKSVTFGGCAKQDVIDYIERTARESAAAQEKLQQENNELQAAAESLRSQVEGLKARLILQVHDELIVECPGEEAEQVRQLLTEEMENAAQLSVPLLADAHIGHSWAEAH